MVRNSSVGEEWELEMGKGMKDGVRVSVEACVGYRQCCSVIEQVEGECGG